MSQGSSCGARQPLALCQPTDKLKLSHLQQKDHLLLPRGPRHRPCWPTIVKARLGIKVRKRIGSVQSGRSILRRGVFPVTGFRKCFRGRFCFCSCFSGRHVSVSVVLCDTWHRTRSRFVRQRQGGDSPFLQLQAAERASNRNPK